MLDSDTLLGCLTAEDLHNFRKKNCTKHEIERLHTLVARELWSDAPPLHGISATTNPKGLKLEQAVIRSGDGHKPFQEEWLAEIGPRILWLIRDLGPNFIVLLEAVASFLSTMDWTKKKSMRKLRVQKFVGSYLRDHPWFDRNGKSLTPPFELRTNAGRRGNAPTEWPPRTWGSIQHLSSTLQTAHLFMALLITAGRIGEVRQLKLDCVVKGSDGEHYIDGLTYKLSDKELGDRKRWPAPPIFVQTLEQQVQLAEVWGKLPPKGIEHGLPDISTQIDTLWLSLGEGAQADAQLPLGSPDAALIALARRVDVDARPDGDNPHPHRFRKTAGKLAGSALFNSPLVLKRLFGHKDIEMTLHYILCDEDVRTDAEIILRELRVLNCAETLEEIREAMATGAPLPAHGGLSASKLEEAVKQHDERLRASGRVWADGSAYDLAWLFTKQGQGWRLIQKNIICTKIPGENGLCRKKRNRGEPDVSNCKTECCNRLVLARERRDVEEIVDYYLDIARQANEDDQVMVLGHSMQCLQEELAAFPDLMAHYLSDPEVQDLLAHCEEVS